MLTKIEIRNFKRFENAVIDLDRSVVFVGPNNSGKTSALQALALWDVGLKQWSSKRKSDTKADKRTGVAINRRDLYAIPIPVTNLLWKDTHHHESYRNEGKQTTKNVRIDIIVNGTTGSRQWQCGLEFDYANEESFYCRPLRHAEDDNKTKISIPEQALSHPIAYLPPMSGLTDREYLKQPGEIAVLIGQGQTAQVLRNLCFNLSNKEGTRELWDKMVQHIHASFGIRLSEPNYYPERSEITLTYRDLSGIDLDISCSGRGLQQTLLLLAYLYANPNSVLLLDEPDAHLEILRQRQIYRLITDVADSQNSQIIAASHSEVVLSEAADKGLVVAFVGRPHKLNDKGTQVLKALRDIGFDQYYQAEQKGWVLYLEDATDLAFLQEYAKLLKHPVERFLQNPFVHYISCDQPQKARDHFYGLQEGKKDLAGIALFDRLDKNLQSTGVLAELMWKKREIENYICHPVIFENYAASLCDESQPLFELGAFSKTEIMKAEIKRLEQAFAITNRNLWSDDIKASDEFMDNLFKNFSKALGMPLLLRKNEYYKLVRFADIGLLDAEVSEKLDSIYNVARQAEEIS